jgi:sulfur transfer protein SufE
MMLSKKNSEALENFSEKLEVRAQPLAGCASPLYA